MSSISGDKKNFKKYLPAAFLVVLTISLMLFFKENRGDFGELVDKGKDDLVSLYTENLQPLLFGTDITNEDVFNFALYQTLPIDKKQNKVLRISEKDGNTFYQVVPSTYKDGTENYENFVKYMGFNETQKTKLDSILESYQPELAEAVLTDEKNTVAISPRLSDLQKAILTNVAAFARDTNKPKFASLFGGRDFAFLDSRKAFDLVNEIKRDTAKDYLIIAKDTAFTSELEFNNKELENKIAELSKKMTSVNSSGRKIKVEAKSDSKTWPVPPQSPKKLNYSSSDTGYAYTYTLPDIITKDSDFDKAAFDSLKIALNALKEELNNISFNLDLDSLHKSLKFDMQTIEGDTALRNMNFEFNFENLGEIINKSIESATKGEMDESYWEQFGVEMDSLAKEMIKVKEDSIKINEDIKKKLEELKKKKAKKK